MKNEWVQLSHGIKVLDKFIFTGKVPYEKIPLYINASEICVVYKKPFKSGFSPLKLYEYMACGKPVVASNVDGFEILEQLKAGSLVKPEDANELAKAIIKLLKDRQLREIMGRNGIEYVKTQSWEAVTRKVEKVCEGVISRYKK
jgi:glycosyltransferase involved in cell wall biosynthesis